LYYPLIRGWGQRLGLQAEDAGDVAQEVFRVLARSIGRFQREQGKNSFRGWLWGITRREIQSYRRRQKPQIVGAGGSDAQRRFAELPESEESSMVAIDSARQDLVHRALLLLRSEFEERTWQAFWRAAVEEHPPAEIAADLGISVNAVYLARSRVLRRLRAEFAEVLD
jgi:RNA polymerase sigma-70 factor (ECF subfamily)